MQVQLSNGVFANIRVLVVSEKPIGFRFFLGMNCVRALGSVSVTYTGEVCFQGDGELNLCAVHADTGIASLRIEVTDFFVSYLVIYRSTIHMYIGFLVVNRRMV